MGRKGDVMYGHSVEMLDFDKPYKAIKNISDKNFIDAFIKYHYGELNEYLRYIYQLDEDVSVSDIRSCIVHHLGFVENVLYLGLGFCIDCFSLFNIQVGAKKVRDCVFMHIRQYERLLRGVDDKNNNVRKFYEHRNFCKEYLSGIYFFLYNTSNKTGVYRRGEIVRKLSVDRWENDLRSLNKKSKYKVPENERYRNDAQMWILDLFLKNKIFDNEQAILDYAIETYRSSPLYSLFGEGFIRGDKPDYSDWKSKIENRELL